MEHFFLAKDFNRIGAKILRDNQIIRDHGGFWGGPGPTARSQGLKAISPGSGQFTDVAVLSTDRRGTQDRRRLTQMWLAEFEGEAGARWAKFWIDCAQKPRKTGGGG